MMIQVIALVVAAAVVLVMRKLIVAPQFVKDMLTIKHKEIKVCYLFKFFLYVLCHLFSSFFPQQILYVAI